MRQQIPKAIEPYRFAHNGQEIIGEIDVADLPRLQEIVHADAGVISVRLRFEIDALGTPVVEGDFTTELTLICERCTEPMQLPMDVHCELALVRHEHFIQGLDEEYEPWIVEPGIDIDPASLIEDELMLALPIVPRHSHPCLPDSVWESQDEETGTQEEKQPASPFAVLADLKKNKDSSD